MSKAPPTTSRGPALKSKLPPNASFNNPDPRILRSLVLDYLCHNCFTGTAKAFVQESTVRQLDADGDEVMDEASTSTGEPSPLPPDELQAIERRQEIKKHLLTGAIDEATELLNEHFPSVLGAPPPTAAAPPPPPADTDPRFTLRTVDPACLALNLRIQAFIEACRVVPLPRDTREPRSRSRSTDEQQRDLLTRARKLYGGANALDRPLDRARYLEELGHVSGLLAYTAPESSPMAKYLTQERREAVADQINSAILYRTGHASVSHIEMYTRYTTVLWSFMKDLHIPPEAVAKPPGVSGAPGSTTSTGSRPTTLLGKIGLSNTSARESERTVPSFDLRQFLDSGA